MKTGNTLAKAGMSATDILPQWSPVMKTGNTPAGPASRRPPPGPQWSPVMKTGNTAADPDMLCRAPMPQWSPVMKTGNTRRRLRDHRSPHPASMEPGHEDREYPIPTFLFKNFI